MGNVDIKSIFVFARGSCVLPNTSGRDIERLVGRIDIDEIMANRECFHLGYSIKIAPKRQNL
jgi:hypothetical protein